MGYLHSEACDEDIASVDQTKQITDASAIDFVSSITFDYLQRVRGGGV